jgi:hypothetical protein
MKEFTVFDQASGRVLWSGLCHDDDFDLQAIGQPGAVVAAGTYDFSAGYFSGGAFVPFPEKPKQGAKWASWDWSAGIWVVDVAQASADVRAERDALLSGTDWTQGRDIPESLAVRWAPYRQALRDIPGQPGFPLDVVWPTAPT